MVENPDNAAQWSTIVNNSWFYILRGQRLGPIAEDDLIAMHRSGTIDDDTLVWTPNAGQGQMGWRPYSEAGLNAVATSEGPVGPPPAPLSQISNKYIWLIVFAPIFLAAVELIEFVVSDGEGQFTQQGLRSISPSASSTRAKSSGPDISARRTGSASGGSSWSPSTYGGVAPYFGKAGRPSGSGLLW
jgi:hypothetical protein